MVPKSAIAPLQDPPDDCATFPIRSILGAPIRAAEVKILGQFLVALKGASGKERELRIEEGMKGTGYLPHSLAAGIAVGL